MALVRISTQLIFHDPKTLQTLYETFTDVEEVPEFIEQPYKTFRLQGQGVPTDDTYIDIGFIHGLDGKTKIQGWSYLGS